MDKIFRKIDNPKTLRIISWGIFIGGNIIYLADLIPQLWFYPFGLFVGAGTAFFDYIAIDSQEYYDELDKIAHCGYYQGDIEGINKMYDKEAYEKKIEAVCEELRNDPEFNKLLNKLSEYLKNK